MSSLSPERTKGGDGGLANQRMRVRELRAALVSEGVPRAGSLRKTSRDRTETSDDSRMGAGDPYRWKTPWIGALTSSSRRGEQTDLGGLMMCHHVRGSVRWRHKVGRRQGCQRCGSMEMHGRNTVHQSTRSRRSGSGVVKRQVLRSLGHGCKPTGQGRGVSLEEIPGTNEARVLVVEVVGSRSRSVRIGVPLRDASQDKAQKGGLAQRKSLKPLTRPAMAQR